MINGKFRTLAILYPYVQDGYVKATKAIFEVTQKLRHGIEAIPGLKILGDPKVCVVAFDSDEFHIYRVADEMKVNHIIYSRF